MPSDPRAPSVLAALLACLLLLSSLPSHAAAFEIDQALRAGRGGRPFRIPRAVSEIGIDAVLDDPAWEKALKIELPYEVWPSENIEAGVQTEALLTYDASHLYAAFRAFDPHPDQIRARLTDRDRAFQDDFVGLVLDTFNDERRAFEFFVNARGVQMDLVQDDVSGREDASWDAIWDSAGKITEEGYVVEMAIPYTSLRFQNSEGDQTWGLDLVRVHPRDVRRTVSMNQRDRDVNCYLCQVGKVVGFEGATPGRNIEITPTLTAIRTDSAPDHRINPGDPNSDVRRFSERSLESGAAQYDPGLTAKWGITPNLTLSGTINPDFSQVEADAGQLAVNERFALFFPDKRPFFLEGADFFTTPLNAVHTRTVVAPRWGTKLTGKEGRNAIGAFVAEDESTSLILPGPQSSSSTFFQESVADGVFRYRRDVGEASAVGGLLTVREGSGNDYSNRVLGADALLRPTQKDTLRIQFLESQTRYPEVHPDDGDLLFAAPAPGDTRDSLEQPEGTFTDSAYYINFSHSVKEWAAWGWHRQLGRDFRADLGFMPQVGTRTSLVGGDYYWWGEEGRNWYSRLTVGGDVDETADYQGNLIEREGQGWIWFDGPMQSHLWFTAGTKQFGFRDDLFTQNFADLWTAIRPSAHLRLIWSTTAGKQVDFAFVDPADDGAARQGDWIRHRPSIEWNLGARLRTDLSHEISTLKIGAGRLFRANLTQLNTTFQLNARTFFRAILQYQDIDRNTDLYPECVTDPAVCGLEKSTRSLFSQLLFSYKVNPQTAVFVGYTENQRGGTDSSLTQAGLLRDGERIGLTPADRTLFFKIGYAFVR